MTVRRLVAAVAVLAPLILAGCNNSHEQAFQGWIEANFIFVAPDESGRVEMLFVREGDQVAPRAPLFNLDADLQQADLAEREATLKNAEAAFERAKTLLRSAAGTQKNYEDAEAAMRTAQARLNSSQTRLARRKVFSPAEGAVQQIYFRVGEMVPAGRPVVALLPPGNIKLRFFVNEAVLPKLKLGDTVNVSCDGCDSGLTAQISFIARTSEFTPPVIYSLDERSKLVFLIEARTDMPGELRVGQPVDVRLGEAVVGEANTGGTKR